MKNETGRNFSDFCLEKFYENLKEGKVFWEEVEKTRYTNYYTKRSFLTL